MSSCVDLSIIIVTWRSLDFLQACLASIYATTKDIAYEIIIVDNASGDDTERVIRREYPQVTFIASQQNLGFASANNLGFRYASGRTLLFLNPDTEVRENVFVRMISTLNASSAGAAGARLLNTDGSLQLSCVQAYPTIWNQLLDSALLRRIFPKWRIWGMQALFQSSKMPARVDAVSGACVMVKREVFQQVGGFTESYFIYVEDLDLCHKITQAGHSILYLGACEIVHHGGKSSAQQLSHFVYLQQKEALSHFFRITKGPWYSDCYRAVIAAAALVRIVIVVLSFPLGTLVLRGSSRGQLIGKWFAVFRWAIGFNPEPAGRTAGIGSGSSSESVT
jgi:N-acetylglucosaminyl-diphospho-decaprenol L-rhamnosyltransferase